MIVRSERLEDRAAIRLVNEQAFGRPDEADLVEKLREEGVVIASFVCEAEGRIAGHILFSRIAIDTATDSISAVALAPVAVIPELQRRGIGGELIRQGIAWLREHGEQIILVLGHPEYYARFGFSAAKASHIESPFTLASFMALELMPNTLQGLSVKVRYPAAFGL